MITQRKTTVKIDCWLDDELRDYCAAHNKKFNRVINAAISSYLQVMKIKEAKDLEDQVRMSKMFIWRSICLDLNKYFSLNTKL